MPVRILVVAKLLLIGLLLVGCGGISRNVVYGPVVPVSAGSQESLGRESYAGWSLDLSDFKMLAGLRTESVPSRSPSLILLTEIGVYKALLLTKKPVGVKLREHFASVIMPQMTRGMIIPKPKEELDARGVEYHIATGEKKLRTKLADHVEQNPGWEPQED